MSNQDAMRQAAKFSTLSQTREEDWAEQIETDMVNRTKSVTPTVGKRPGTHQGRLVEGGCEDLC